MRVNLSEFLALSAADQARVTHLDLALSDDPPPWRNKRIRDFEEYEGEAAACGLGPDGYNK